MIQFILFSGIAQAGKDTSAQIMKEELEKTGKSVLIIHYADLLKFICKQFFGWDGLKDERGRTLLQFVGTDRVRAQDPDYWVNFIVSIAQMFPNAWDYMLIPDMRFPNERTRIADAGFRVVHIHIERPDFDNGLTEEQRNHPSETALRGIQPDFLVRNTAISLLRSQIEEICKAVVAERSI